MAEIRDFMTAKPDDFEKELARFAKTLVKRAALDATPFPESVDAFKVLTTYYGLRKKHKADSDDEDEESFEAFAAELEEQAHGKDVRSRSRRPS